MHVHTKYSFDSNIEPGLLLKALKKKKFDGVAVTDHDTIEGGLVVKKLNKDKNFKVFVGSEIRSEDGDILGYNLNEEIISRKPMEILDEIKGQGGISCIPHPFDKMRSSALKYETILEIVKKVDLIEGLNARASLFFNKKAIKFAEKYKKPVTGGSDAHHLFDLGRAYTIYNNQDLKKPEGIKSDLIPFYWAASSFRTLIYKKLSI